MTITKIVETALAYLLLTPGEEFGRSAGRGVLACWSMRWDRWKPPLVMFAAA